MNGRWSSYLSLLASSTTLICCTLPAVFVLVGAGATFASLISHMPFLVTLSRYKHILTIGAAILLILSLLINRYVSRLPCPIDSEKSQACMAMRKRSRYITTLSICVFFLGTVVTYILPYVR